MKQLIKNIGLLLFAIICMIAILPLGIITTFVMFFIKDTRCPDNTPSDAAFRFAFATDIFLAMTCAPLLNICLIKHGGYLIGRDGESLSSALGVNYLRKKGLLRLASRIQKVLDKIDADHCSKAAHAYHTKQREIL